MTTKKRNILLSALFVLVMVFTIVAFANINQGIVANAYSNSQNSTVITNADFADDTVLVVMNNEETLKFNSYTELDFPEVDLREVISLTETSENLLQEQINNSSKQTIDAAKFKSILSLKLKEPGKENVLKAIEKLSNRKDLYSVEPDYVLISDATSPTPNDTYYNFQEIWLGSETGIKVSDAWNITCGSNTVRVGIIDTGIDSSHPDLINRVNKSLSRDFTINAPYISNDVVDSYGHGTHVAGIIGAEGNNSVGISGVSQDVELVSLRITTDGSATHATFASRLVLAINYANTAGIKILNNSNGIDNFSGSISLSNAVREAINSYNGLFVTSAGNNKTNIDEDPYFPAMFQLPNMITVGALNIYGNDKASFSNFGENSVDIYAPGDMILSTYPIGEGKHFSPSSDYEPMSGTSMSAPFISGVAALMLSANPSLSGSQLKAFLTTSADTIDISVGAIKKVNAYKAVKNVQIDTSLFKTTNLADNKIRIDGINNSVQGILNVPNSINNRIVTQIADEAFSQQTEITEVFIPNTIESIGNAAFMNCVNLVNVFFDGNSKLTYINGYAFQQCLSLKSLTIPSTVTNISYGISSFGEKLTFYTDLKSDPSTWNNHWNRADWISIERPVVWGCKLSEDNSYVVSLNKTSSSITKVNAVNGISAPCRKGYTFGGWYKNSNFSGTAVSAGDIATAANTTYYAKWIPNHEVVFDTNGGSFDSYFVTVEDGAKISKPLNHPIKTGYVFKYWALSTDLTQEYNWTTSITNSIKLKAVWQVVDDNRVVTFDLDGGVGPFNTQALVENGTTVTRPSSPTKVGYKFNYWALAGQTSAYNFNTPVTSDITLVAIWQTAQTCTIKFDLNGGYGNFQDITINRYEQIEKPFEEPVKVGNYFKYWALSTNLNQEYDWNTYIDKNITLVAVWENFRYSVTFDLDGGSFGLVGLTLNEGDTVGEFLSKPGVSSPTKTGYTFKYWALSTNTSVAYNLNTPVTNSFKLKAIWNINTYTVSFDLAGGSGSFPAKTIKYGSTVSKPTSNPTRDGYTFKYWALSGQSTEYNFSTPVTSNIKLVAIWEKNQCIASGTLITLADGRQVPVENLTGSEMLLVWNMYTGKFDTAPILFIDKDPLNTYEIIRLCFSDGTMVDVISEHGFFDVNLNKYVYLDRHASDYIGHSFLKQNANGMVQVTLENVDLIEKTTEAYSPVTYGHLCYYVNGMLSMPGGIDGLFNIFEVDSDTMKFDTEAMADDIEQYGLFTYEELNALVPVPEVMFEAVNGQYLKVAIGKGVITLDQVRELINKYSYLFA